MNSKKQKPISINFKLEPKYDEYIKTICEKTNESRADLLRRLLSNELAKIEGRDQDINSSMQTIAEFKLNHIINQLIAMDKRTATLSENVINVFKGLGYLAKNIFVLRYYLSQFFKDSKDIKKEYAARADLLATKSIEPFFDKITQSTVKEYAQYLKTPKSQNDNNG